MFVASGHPLHMMGMFEPRPAGGSDTYSMYAKKCYAQQSSINLLIIQSFHHRDLHPWSCGLASNATRYIQVS